MKQGISPEIFEQVRNQVLQKRPAGYGIGTLGEKCLHAVLKTCYQPDERLHERKIGRMTADAILSDGSILEIQTGSFAPLLKKLPILLSCGPVHLAAPVIRKKWLCWIDPETGEVVSKRRSPKQYAPIDLSRELLRIRTFLSHPGLTVHFPILEGEEYRLLNGWGNGGKRGSARYERIPLALLEEWVMETPTEYSALFPQNLPTEFTVKQLEKSARISSRCAYSAAGVFRELGLVEIAGKQGRAVLYRRTDSSFCSL